MKIVSLLPSATEILCALGLRDQLVGVSHECDYPACVRDLPRVTRSTIDGSQSSPAIDREVRRRLTTQKALYTLDEGRLRKLQPDLFVTQALCDVCAVSADEVDAVAGRLPGNPRVINLEPESLGDVFATILTIGDATGRTAEARQLCCDLHGRVGRVSEKVAGAGTGRRVVGFLEWVDPPFSAGHWTPELIELAGATDAFGNAGEPSRTLDWAEIVAAGPDTLFIACCGYSIGRTLEDLPALRRRTGWATLPCVRQGRIFVADGNHYFNRPGPRLVDSLELLAATLHAPIELPRGVSPAVRVPV